MRINDLKEKRARLVDKAGAIIKKDNLSSAEERHFDELHVDAAKLLKTIERMERQEDGYFVSEKIKETDIGREDTDGDPPIRAGDRSHSVITPEDGETWRDESGREVRLYGHNEKIEPPRKSSDDDWKNHLDMGKIFRGICTGNWAGAADERRAMVEGTDSAGGFLVPDLIANEIIELVRNQSAVNRAGIRTILIESDNVRMVKETQGFTTGWVGENVAPSVGDAVFAAVTFVPKVLISMGIVSMELIEDSSPANLNQFIQHTMAKSIATELDRTLLNGSGSGAEPRGILNVAGIGSIDHLGATADYDMISNAISQCEIANFDPNAYLISARDNGITDRLKDSTNQPLQPSPAVARLRKIVSNQVPVDDGSPNEGVALVGEFRHCIMAVRRQLQFHVSRDAADSSNSAFAQRQVWFRAFMRVDMQLAHDLAFCKITNIE